MDSHEGAILIVDDEFSVREALKMILKSSYKVATAKDGEEGIKLLEKEPFHLAILDIEMPGLSGLETLAEIKKRWPLVEVIIVTAHGTIRNAKEAISQGALDFLSKPFNVVEVIDAARNAFKRRALAAGDEISPQQVSPQEIHI
jgi:DNA-binding NtrC family response regulator